MSEYKVRGCGCWINAQWSRWEGQHGWESEWVREQEWRTQSGEVVGNEEKKKGDCSRGWKEKQTVRLSPDCACRAIISAIPTKRRIIMRGPLLCHRDFFLFTGTDTPCRLSLISPTLLNQYGHDYDRTTACASCRSGKRRQQEKNGWSDDRRDERRKWCRVAFLWEG